MQLQCHCGNVEITIENKPEMLTRCNCSMCSRYAALWGYYSPEIVDIKIGDKGLSNYSWGGKYLDFKNCTECGCVTHYITTAKAPKQKVGINFRMAPIKSIADIQVRDFDGADSWQYLN